MVGLEIGETGQASSLKYSSFPFT